MVGKMEYLGLTVLLKLSFVTSVIVPLGVFWHYWRRSNVLTSPTAAPGLTSSSPWARTLRRQVWLARAASAVVFGIVASMLLDVGPLKRDYDGWISYIVPIALAVVCIGAIACMPDAAPRGKSGDVGQLDLTTRSLWAFGRRFMFASWIAVAVTLCATLLLAGLASTPDDDGNFTRLTIKVGATAAASASFPGWYFGAPVFLGVALLAAITGLALSAGARPPFAADLAERSVDVWLRLFRTRTVLTLGGGALTLTLAWVLMSIGSAASATISLPAGDLGTITVGSSLAAVAVVLKIIGLILQGVGVALLLLPLLTRQPRLVLTDRSASAPTDAVDEAHMAALRN